MLGFFNWNLLEFIGFGEENGHLYNESSHSGNGKFGFLFILVFLYVHQSFLHMALHIPL